MLRAQRVRVASTCSRLGMLALLGCGSASCGSAGTPSPSSDASAPDAPPDAPVDARAADRDGAPDADDCALVGCTPLACGASCTARCGCCSTGPCPAPDGEAPDAAPFPADGGPDGSAVDAGQCVNAGDCRIFTMCGTCTCAALPEGEAEPVCSGPPVECLVNPCNGRSAACANGVCAAQ